MTIDEAIGLDLFALLVGGRRISRVRNGRLVLYDQESKQWRCRMAQPKPGLSDLRIHFYNSALLKRVSYTSSLYKAGSACARCSTMRLRVA